MEPYTAAFLSTVALLLFATFLHHRRRPTTLRLPPGPKPWPIIGNLHLIGSLPHRSIHHLTQRYGPVLRLKFGSKNVVVFSSVETAKLVLNTMDTNFICRPKNAAGKHTTYNYTDITWSPYGPYWRQARKLCVIELFSAKRIDSFEYIRTEEMAALTAAVRRSSGEPVVLRNFLSTMSLNVISRMVLGRSYLGGAAVDGGDGRQRAVGGAEFKRMLDELFLLNGVFNVGDWIPWLGFMDLQGYVRRMKAVSRKFDGFLEGVLEEHERRRTAEGDGFAAADMVDVLLQLSGDPTLEVKLERDGVKGFAQDLLAGGTESSTMTIEWAITELLRNPEIFQKATEELDRVIGRDRWVKEKDMPDLPYIKAIAKEAMRLHPVAPLLTLRRTREDCKVAGYDIPEDTRVFVSTWTLGRDPELWDNPLEFCPQRFIENETDMKGTNFKFMPFGAGRRMCPGYSLGLKVIESSLANLLHGFNWKLPGQMTRHDIDMEEIFGLTTPKKNPLVTVPHPRLPLEMYPI
ncbi:hypothetical protein OSB04_004456 [Centaurea solstitialis]|uniref:Cytochrome P450 n=1 Tax=Centaurea solstitialis TaxID=347529 RepID=A0AA38WUB5_9ASTR|nr:hypothetical protein OSB04_004456 [Centaurea solstitialis]